MISLLIKKSVHSGIETEEISHMCQYCEMPVHYPTSMVYMDCPVCRMPVVLGHLVTSMYSRVCFHIEKKKILVQ